jgi:hypothetical protein
VPKLSRRGRTFSGSTMRFFLSRDGRSGPTNRSGTLPFIYCQSTASVLTGCHTVATHNRCKSVLSPVLEDLDDWTLLSGDDEGVPKGTE